MSGHTTFIKKLFDEKEIHRRESEKLQSKLTLTNQIIAILEKSNDFYCEGELLDDIYLTDEEDEEIYRTGKTARQAKQEVEKLRSENEHK